MVSMPINNKLFNFTKTSAHVILYLLNWNLFAWHKDSLAESTSHSTAERVQKGPQDEQLLQAEGGSARAMPGDQISTALREAGDCQSQHWGTEASEVTMAESSARSPDASGQH